MENRVSKEQMSALPYIIAVDFDGTLVEDKFPEIGKKRPTVWARHEHAKRMGAKIILWTSRDHENLEAAVEYCKSEGLTFDAVNENIKECQELFNNDTRKVYANEYWDDRAIGQFCERIFTDGKKYTIKCAEIPEFPAAVYG